MSEPPLLSVQVFFPSWSARNFHHLKPTRSFSKKLTKSSRREPNRLVLDTRPERRLHSTALREFTRRTFGPPNRTISTATGHPFVVSADAPATAAVRKFRGNGRRRTVRRVASGLMAIRSQEVSPRPVRKMLPLQLAHFRTAFGRTYDRATPCHVKTVF